MKTLYRHREAFLTTLDDGPLAGLRHRTVIDHRGGAAGLALWQEEHAGGFYVPPHRHDCEEVITVLEGEIEAEIEGRKYRVAAEESVLIPAWELHGFRVVSEEPVKLLAIFASSAPKILKEDGTESLPPWEGGASDHLERSRSPARV